MPVVTRKSPYAFLPPLPRQGRGGTVQRVQDVIRDAIVRLELPPGTTIDKAALCAQLGVSRFPVSEALGRLAAEGFVEILPQRGTHVARIDMGDCHQAMFIRRALEVEAMRSIASRADAPLLATLERNLCEQEAVLPNENSVRFHQLDLELHEVLMDFLGFERVKNAVETARGSLDRARLFMCTPQRKMSTFREHAALVAALKRHDADAAVSAMERHLDAVMAELLDFAGRNPEAVAEPRETAAA
jgi:GntR family transcriptional regulator, rspAB operon transcriptional repressor